MRNYLNEVIELQGPVDEALVERTVKFMDQSLVSIKTVEAVLKHFKDKLRGILTKDLLEWMQENDQVNFETDDVKVSIRTNVSAKMLDPSTGFQWLIERQYGDVIKDTLDFPKGEFTEEAQAALDNLGLSYSQKQGVHPQTLIKILRDRLNDGEDLPDESEGIKVGYFDECVVKTK